MKTLFLFCSFISFPAWAEVARVEIPLQVVSLIESKPEQGLRESPTRVGWNSDRSEGITATLEQVLDFGKATGGDAELRLSPEEKGAAVITLTGKPGRIVRVTLPPGVEMESECQCGYIIAEFFTSDALNGVVTLNSRGLARLRIGATREALPFNLKPDRYRGTTKVVFSIE